MRLDRPFDLLVRPVADGDAIGVVEVGGAAPILDPVDDLAREPLGDQVVVQVDVEGDQQLAVPVHGDAGTLFEPYLDLVRFEVRGFAVELDRDAPGSVEFPLQIGAVPGSERGAHGRHRATEPRAALRVVRHDVEGNVLGAVGGPAHFVNVQFLGHEIDVWLDQGFELRIGADQGDGAQRLADLDAVRVARRAAVAGNLEHGRHRRLEPLVGAVRGRLGPGLQVATDGAESLAREQAAMEFLGDEGHEGRDEKAQRGQDFVERLVRAFLRVGLRAGAGLVVGRPEPVAAAPDVPVRQLLEKRLDAAGGRRGAVAAEMPGRLANQPVKPEQDPAIELVPFGEGDLVPARPPAVEVGVDGEEGQCIPQGQQEGLGRFPDEPGREAGRLLRVVHAEVPAQRIGAGLGQHLHRLDDVAEPLGHLAAVLVVHVSQDDAVAIGRAVEEQAAEDVQGVEPAPGLVDRLGDEVRREAGPEGLPVLERVVVLGEGHGARVEPGVDHVLDPFHRAGAVRSRARPLEVVVDERPVRIEAGAVVRIFRQGPAHLAEEFLEGTDHLGLAAAAALPDRQRRAPVAAAGQGPVDDVLEPVAEASLADVLGVPVDFAVLLDQPVAGGGRAHEPARRRVVEQRLIAAPAEGVAVVVPFAVEQAAPQPQRADDLRVGVLEPVAVDLVDEGPDGGIVGAGGCVERDPALRVDRLQLGQTVLAAALLVVLAEQRRRVDRAGALGKGDVVGEQNAETGGVRHFGGAVRAARLDRERPVVEDALEGPAREARRGRGFPQVDPGRLAVAGNENRHGSLEVLGDQQ